MSDHPPDLADTPDVPPPTADQDSRHDEASPTVAWWRRWAFVALVALFLFTLAAVMSRSSLMTFWDVSRAQASYVAGEIDEALQLMDRAVERRSDDAALLFDRAVMRLEAQNVEGALDDLNRVIELSPSFAPAYTQRSGVRQRLGEHEAAIADLEKVTRLRPEWEATPWNNLAYGRALAGTDLEQALVEVQRALELAEDDPLRYVYLDTRGVVYHQLDRNAEALADLDEAIRLAEEDRVNTVRKLDAEPRRNPLDEMYLRKFDEQLSVLYHHRGEINQALGSEGQAGFDFRRADSLGYDPERGVY